jgi:hypothetical protein
MFTKTQFWAELEQVGEDVVRERVGGKVYSEGNYKLAFAKEWLRLQEMRRSDGAAAAAHQLNVENLRTTKSARYSAWLAATCAVIAVVFSIATASGSTPDVKVYTLYRNSVTDEQMRIHVATFDALESGEYNRGNCEQAQLLFQNQAGVKTIFWCEKGRFEK